LDAFTMSSMTGISTSGPTMVATACGELVPKIAVVAASASSKLAVNRQDIHLPATHHTLDEYLHLRLDPRDLTLVCRDLVIDELAAKAAST